MTGSKKVKDLLKLDYSDKSSVALTDQDTLRKLVGVLGMLLPVLLFLFVLIDVGYATPLESISHYYFTRATGVFVIVVSLLAIFLLIYKGQELIDFYISSAAGLFALTLLLFPTSNLSEECRDLTKAYSVTILKVSDARVAFHYASAGIFLSSLAYMSAFLFTRSDKSPSERTKWKRRRNRVYRTCGGIMVLALLVIFARFLDAGIPAAFYDNNHFTFWMETVAVESFGFSWLVKGRSMLTDR